MKVLRVLLPSHLLFNKRTLGREERVLKIGGGKGMRMTGAKITQSSREEEPSSWARAAGEAGGEGAARRGRQQDKPAALAAQRGGDAEMRGRKRPCDWQSAAFSAVARARG
jgi:hypothetical protein